MKNLKLQLILFVLFVSRGAIAQQDVTAYGAPISSAQAQEWVSNYKDQNETTTGVYFGKEILNYLTSFDNVSGVYLFRALDKQNREVLVLRPCDRNGNFLDDIFIGNGSLTAGKNIASAGSLLLAEKAQKMIENFQKTNADRTQGFIFSTRGFNTILNERGTEGILFVNGLDANGDEHIIFVGTDKNGQYAFNGGNTIWNHGSGIGVTTKPLVKR